MGWALVGKITVWFLTFGLIYGIFRGFEIWAGDEGLRGLYRAIVHLEVGMLLGGLIFLRSRP